MAGIDEVASASSGQPWVVPQPSMRIEARNFAPDSPHGNFQAAMAVRYRAPGSLISTTFVVGDVRNGVFRPRPNHPANTSNALDAFRTARTGQANYAVGPYAGASNEGAQQLMDILSHLREIERHGVSASDSASETENATSETASNSGAQWSIALQNFQQSAQEALG